MSEFIFCPSKIYLDSDFGVQKLKVFASFIPHARLNAIIAVNLKLEGEEVIRLLIHLRNVILLLNLLFNPFRGDSF